MHFLSKKKVKTSFKMVEENTITFKTWSTAVSNYENYQPLQSDGHSGIPYPLKKVSSLIVTSKLKVEVRRWISLFL